MPYLRFARDKRGYENTYVLHAGGAGGKSRPRMLYWFRTPPNVKVGRLPLDAEALLAVEVHNPDVTFDWNRMLKVCAVPRTGRGESVDRGARKRTRRSSAKESKDHRANLIQETDDSRIVESISASMEVSHELNPLTPIVEESTADSQLLEVEAYLDDASVLGDDREEPQVRLDYDEHPVVTLMGHETLARLRARYAEIQARVSEKSLDSVDRESIRTRVDALNPDQWTTIESTVTSIERFEADVEAIKSQLGRRPARVRRT